MNVTVDRPDRQDRFILSGFEPGNATLEAAPVEAKPSREQHRAIELAEPGRWGIVEGEASVYPYPPSEAIERLHTDPSRSRGLP